MSEGKKQRKITPHNELRLIIRGVRNEQKVTPRNHILSARIHTLILFIQKLDLSASKPARALYKHKGSISFSVSK